jgi:hypothetical protein
MASNIQHSALLHNYNFAAKFYAAKPVRNNKSDFARRNVGE